MKLEGVEPAIKEAQKLLGRARDAGIPIFHIQHDAGVGSPYDVNDRIGAISDEVAPKAGETVIVKNYPSAFVGTDLQEKLEATGVKDLVIAGFHDAHVREFDGAQRLQPRLPADYRRGDDGDAGSAGCRWFGRAGLGHSGGEPRSGGGSFRGREDARKAIFTPDL